MCEDHAEVLRELRKTERKLVEAILGHDYGAGVPCEGTEIAVRRLIVAIARDVRGRVVLNADAFKSAHDLEDDEEYVRWRNGILMSEILGGEFGLN